MPDTALSRRQASVLSLQPIAYAKNGKLVSVKILSDGAEGDDLMTDEIKAEWAEGDPGERHTETDAITGATLKFSATAVREATTEILDKMNEMISRNR